jgi:hypothetical protein
MSPSASQERKAEEEILNRRATSEIRRSFGPAKDSDSLAKFFLLDTAPGFL